MLYLSLYFLMKFCGIQLRSMSQLVSKLLFCISLKCILLILLLHLLVNEIHYSDITLSVIVYQITGISTVCSTVYSGAHHTKYPSPASLAFVRGIHRRPADSPHKGPATWKMFPFDDVIMKPTFRPQQENDFSATVQTTNTNSYSLVFPHKYIQM